LYASIKASLPNASVHLNLNRAIRSLNLPDGEGYRSSSIELIKYETVRKKGMLPYPAVEGGGLLL
jgi:hypothetical protein